jgi:arylsulfatase A-like enzyme
VLLVLADDLGTLDLNCFGSKDLQTPHLDGLAARGVRLTQFYVAAPVCSPSRAALLTGRVLQRAGVRENFSSRPGQEGMPTEELTMAELLRAAGYHTALFGKWYVGTVPACEPNGQGFDKFFGHKSGCIDNYSHFFYWQGPPYHDLWRNDKEVWEDGTHFSDLIVREARRFLGENKDRPFFLYLPFNSLHYPLPPPLRYRRLYEDLAEPRRSYAATVTALDASVGAVLDRLDELKLTDETLVLFFSDHGHSTEERADFGGGNAGPYRGAKFSLLEGGIRVPCIASWPRHIPANEVRGQMAVSVDWFPTVPELCGVGLPDRKLEGRSLAPVLNSAEARTPHGVFHWQFGDQWAVREGDWKLVVNGRDTSAGAKLEAADRVFLSDLATDATERKNLAEAHPGTVKRLTGLHEGWAAEVGNGK